MILLAKEGGREETKAMVIKRVMAKEKATTERAQNDLFLCPPNVMAFVA